MSPINVAIFASGNGSNAMALVKRAQEIGSAHINISFILTDQPQAGVLQKSAQLKVKSILVPRLTTKQDHEEQIFNKIKDHQIDWIFLAGYMRLLSSDFLNKFSLAVGTENQIVNIHPSLLPAYPGVNSIARAYHDQAAVFGVTLHCVDAGTDTGHILRQESLQPSHGESLEALEKRIHHMEHKIYTEFLADISVGKVPTKKFFVKDQEN